MILKSHFTFIYYFVLTVFLISCNKDANNGSIAPNNNAYTESELLNSFIDENGGESEFSANQLLALETLLLAQEDLEAGRLEKAEERINAIFNRMPLSSPEWRQISANSHCSGCPFNFGAPTAYYGLRMLQQIVALGNPESSGSLTMTAVIAPCAEVTRPTLPDLVPETVNLNIAPEILDDNSRLLHVSSSLFRMWVQAITGGLKVNLRVHVLDDCTTVDYNDEGDLFYFYSNPYSLVDSVPDNIADDTDFWWVITPSGIPDNIADFNKNYISGGMGGYGQGLPLLISDDFHFINKAPALGSGKYQEVEIRAYQPQWFQHEFMHHFYYKWNEFGLEEKDHQWFDRSTWPSDFVGKWEPDYYIESINKRLLNASPSLAEGLKAPDSADFNDIDSSIILGQYERKPVENKYHEVEIANNNNLLTWQNAAGVSWSLTIIDGELWTGADCPYGEQKLTVLLDINQKVTSIYFSGESYKKIN